VWPVGGSLRKLSTGTQLQNLPLSNAIKIVFVLQRLHGEIGRPNSDVQKCDGQKQKTQYFWRPRWRVKSKPNQSWHGDRGPSSTFLHRIKLLGAFIFHSLVKSPNAPMGWNLAWRRGPLVPLHAKFHPIGATCCPKTSKLASD